MEELMRRFEGKVVLITGAASGIGRATAERLAEEGAKVVCADVQAEALEDTAKRVRELGSEVHSLLCDVSEPEAVSSAVRDTVERFGALHSVCNSAGVLRFGHTHEFPLEQWQRILSVNLTGTFLMCRAAIPHLLECGGNIVNIASTAALAGHPWTCAYSASKGGVLALTRGIAVEYGKQGLRANAVCPGSVTTPMHEEFSLPEGADIKLLKRIMPLDKFRGPETVAGAVAFLASDDAAHINGVALRVDGATLT
jgi:NAD(P)-dependent dehydrogenase (short-subunit alcohol dehydrogenase family)